MASSQECKPTLHKKQRGSYRTLWACDVRLLFPRVVGMGWQTRTPATLGVLQSNLKLGWSSSSASLLPLLVPLFPTPNPFLQSTLQTPSIRTPRRLHNSTAHDTHVLSRRLDLSEARGQNGVEHRPSGSLGGHSEVWDP